MGDFSILSNYNKKSGFKSVRIGSDAPVLETELNELQEIADHKIINFIKHFIGNGLSSLSNIIYDASSSILLLRDNFAFVDGYLVEISSLSLVLEEGQTAYLQVWEETVSYNDTLKLYGNEQETNLLDNYLLDNRINEETSKRIQVKYNLVNTCDTPNRSHLEIGYVSDGKFTLTVKVTHNYDEFDGGDFNSDDISQVIIDGGYF